MPDDRERLADAPLDVRRQDIIDFFVKAAHCVRWESQEETAAAFVDCLDRYIDARIAEGG